MFHYPIVGSGGGGVIPVANGGTGSTNVVSARESLQTAYAGNPSLIPLLQHPTDLVTLHCSPAGDDVSGDGSLANPFQQVQRALDEIPTADIINGIPQGIVIVQCLAGNYLPFTLRPLSTNGLIVFVNGDVSVGQDLGVLPAGTRPALVHDAGHSNAASFNYVVPALTGGPFTAGSHWVDQPLIMTFGSFSASTPDWLFTTGTNLRVVETFDIGGFDAFLRPIVCTVDLTGLGENAAITNQNANHNEFFYGGVSLVVQGFKLTADFNVACVGANMYGCHFTGVANQANGTFFNNQDVNQSCVYDVDNLYISGGLLSTFDGIWNTTNNVALQGPMAEVTIQGVVRSNPAWFIGGPTNGRLGPPSDFLADSLNFESTAGLFNLNGAVFRWTHDGTVSLDNPTGWFLARFGARTSVNGSVVGKVAGIPVIVEAGVHGYSGYAGLSGNVVNSSVAGQDVKIRSDASDTGTIFTFAQLPQTDVAILTRMT